MREISKCPVCKKRVYDIICKDTTLISIKCPHCGKVVLIKHEKTA